MHIPDSSNDFLIEVAKSCDYCLKPWRYSVIDNSICPENSSESTNIDLTLKVECRDQEGRRIPEHDLEVEVYRSGDDLSITLSWLSFPEQPILWHGKHSVWMDSSTGKRCQIPEGGASLEALARRLRTSFLIEE